MARTADHDERRRQVLDAVCRLTISAGLEAVTFRSVASDAGVSVRLVQYYFGTKDGLLAAANLHTLDLSAERLVAAIGALAADADHRQVVRAVMRSFLPVDPDARAAIILFYAFYTARLAQPEGVIRDAHDYGGGLHRLLATHIAAGQADGSVPASVDADHEASLLFLVLPSIVSGSIAGTLRPDQAEELIDYAIDRVFGAGGDLPRSPSRLRKTATVSSSEG
jgi:TetR/AcrR family transcriptional repressor of bet genes